MSYVHLLMLKGQVGGDDDKSEEKRVKLHTKRRIYLLAPEHETRTSTVQVEAGECWRTWHGESVYTK